MKQQHFKKLLGLSKLIGVKVVIKKSEYWDGEWNSETKTITLYFDHSSWTDKVLTLSHELGHVLDDRVSNRTTSEAYGYLPDKENKKYIPKWAREAIKNREDAANHHREVILRFLGISVSKRKLEADKAINSWIYGYILYNNGKHPSFEQINNFKKSWKEAKGYKK